MKKISYLILSFALSFFAGCQNEEGVFENETSKQTDVLISASLEDDTEARTALGGENRTKVLWQEDDQLSVFLGNTTNKRYVLVNGAGETRADFESDSHTISGGFGTETYAWANVAYYPYDENITLAKENDLYKLNVVLPTTQEYAEESFGQNAAPYVAVTQGKGDFEFLFKNVAAVIGVKLIGNATITKVTLKSEANKLAGPAVVTTDGIEPNVVVEPETGSSTILLNCGENGVVLDASNYKRFTFVIPPGTYPDKDLTFTVYDNTGKYQSYTLGKVDIARSGNMSAKRSFDNPQEVVKVKLNGEGSHSTIEEAVAAITDATKTNTIFLYDGVYTLPEITNQNIVFEPQGECDVVKINMSETSHVDKKYEGSNLTFKNIVLTGGTYNGKYNGYVQSVSETYNECTFEDYYMFAGDKVIVTDCTFNGIEGSYFWTGSAGELAFTNCKFNGVDRALKVLSVGNAQEIARKVTFTNCQFTSTISNKAVLEFDSSLANSPFEVTVTGCIKSDVFPAWYSDKKDSDNYILTIDGIQVYPGYAKVDDAYEIYSPKGLVYAATNLFPKGGTFNIQADIDMTDVEYPYVKITNEAGTILINGNNKIIKNMGNQLISETGSASSVTVKDLTLDGTKFNIAPASSNGSLGIAAFIGYAGTSREITLDNCHVVNAEIEGGKWTGGLVGYAAGYNAANNGPVFETLTIKDCSVKNSSIIGHDTSCGAVIGHATGDLATLVKIEGVEVTGNTITTDDDNKAGVILGTVGAAGPAAWNGELGGTYITGATVSGNTVTANGVANTKLYGRQGSTGGVLYIDGVQVIFEAAQLATSLTSDKATIKVVLANNIDLPITSLGSQTAGSGEYKLGSESTQAIIIDLNGQKLNITTTYWSAIGAKNDNATITIKNGSMTSTGNSAGTWNAFDVRLSNCNYVIENVTFDKPVALDNVGKITKMNTVTINDDGDRYALWITAEGQTVEIDGLTVNTSGRGIKIDEEYVSSPAKVNLKVSNANFTTVKKAAILVKSAAGADIALDNVDINNVAADKVNAVWVDEDAIQHYGLVSVTGGNLVLEETTKLVEGVLRSKDEKAYYIVNAAGLNWLTNEVNTNSNNFKGKAVNLLVDIDLANAAQTRIGQYGATSFEGTFDGMSHTISNFRITASDAEKSGNYATAFFGRATTATVIKNLTLDQATIEGHHWTAALVGYNHGKVENCHVTNSIINCSHIDDDACGDKAGAIAGICADGAGKLIGCSATDCTVKGVRDVGQLVGAAATSCVDSACKATNVKVGVHKSFTECDEEGSGSAGMNISSNSLIGRIL